MKETYYFSHDYNCREDEKIMKLIRVLGMEGYGVYWAIVEMLAMNGGYLKYSSIEDISYQLHINNTVITELLQSFNLFTINEKDDVFFSERLLNHFEKRDNDKKRKSEAGKKGMAKRWGKDNTVITEDNKVKETKVKENKIKEIKNIYSKKSFEYEQSKIFLDFHKENNSPSIIYLLKNKTDEDIIQEWCDGIEKLKRIDLYTEAQISYIINFTIGDDFWKDQIQNIAKFRKKNKDGIPYFIVMIEQMKKVKNILSPKNGGGVTARI